MKELFNPFAGHSEVPLERQHLALADSVCQGRNGRNGPLCRNGPSRVAPSTKWIPSDGREPGRTDAWVENLDEAVRAQISHLKLVKRVGPQAVIVGIPRHQEFTAIASILAQHGVSFVEIAENSQVTLSVLAPQAWHHEGSDTQQLFSMPVLTRPGWQRVVLKCTVPSLAQSLSALHSDAVVIERVYDY